MAARLVVILLGVVTLLLPSKVTVEESTCSQPYNPRPKNCDFEGNTLPCTCVTEICWAGATMQTCRNSDECCKDWYACHCNSTSFYTGRCYSTGFTLAGYNGNYNNYISAYSGNPTYSQTFRNPQCLGQPKNCTSESKPLEDKIPCSCTPASFPKGCQMQPCSLGENTYDQYQCICIPGSGAPFWNDMCSNGTPWDSVSSLSGQILSIIKP